jgi:hypothetical protein
MEAREMIPNDALTVDRELGIGLMAHHWNKSKPPHGRRHSGLWKCITSLKRDEVTFCCHSGKRLTHEFYGLPYQISAGWLPPLCSSVSSRDGPFYSNTSITAYHFLGG